MFLLAHYTQCVTLGLKFVLLHLGCHQDTARLRVVDGQDGLQTWKVAENIQNKK